ncbi:glycosyltransferase family 4 protein [Lyngbya confervoides]|uniref:Glycosyltransferase family 4 protein n=1 Tax=Lyngbya confervoides BDU141951 TaxID=1574623 RepID=A0ABD4T3K5_9CYAN|nr:glycosyltransferase family 4 protein [Lyngbya confervoides]MCM1983010.1 glycosyltransferase family 4 protein [Lyngbya confervoides BDU141951]
MQKASLDYLRSLAHPIAFSHYGAKHDIGGVTTWLERFVIRLHKDSIPIVVYLQHFGADPEDSWLFQSLSQAGVPVEIEPRARYLEDDVSGVLRFLNRHQPQAFFPQCLASMHYGAKQAAKSGLPWAMTIHSDDPVYWAIAEATPPGSNIGVMVGVSDFICQKAVDQRLTQSPQSIPYGVPIPPHQASFSDTPFRVAFSGRVVEEQKRISLVLAAMAQACRQDSRIQCWILGQGAALTAAQNWVEQQGLCDQIQFLGRLSPGDVQNHLAQCQALLLMSDYEGLPVALLEAMAIGVVPIARAIPSGIPELVHDRETGFLVDHTPESAAAAIVHLANHPDLWLKCSGAARALVVDQYSEDVCYQRWLNIIAELCHRSTVTYPIPIPRKMVLPSIYPDLLEGDRRRPPLLKRLLIRSKHHARPQLSRVKRFILALQAALKHP